VMEYVRGQSLDKVLATEPPFAIARAVRIAGSILEGLAAVHARGIVHRDLKPENVMLTTKGGDPDFVKLFDFGISTFSEAMLDPHASTDLTPSGRTMGTPFYASPEQIQGERGRDARVDIYATGVLLYQMLAGRRPFEEKTFPELCRAILERAAAPLSDARPDVPAGLEAVVRGALAKKPEARFQTALEMAQALVPFGAKIPRQEPEPTDTFTWDMRELKAREAQLRSAAAQRDGEPVRDASDGVRGEVLRVMLESLRARLGGPRYERLIDESHAAVRAVLRGPIDPAAWYPGTTLSVLETADRDYAAGDRRMLADAGRLLAQRTIGPGSRDAIVRTVTDGLPRRGAGEGRRAGRRRAARVVRCAGRRERRLRGHLVLVSYSSAASASSSGRCGVSMPARNGSHST